jgi:hypothetical protein
MIDIVVIMICVSGGDQRIFVHDLASHNITEKNIQGTVNLKEKTNVSHIQLENGDR